MAEVDIVVVNWNSGGQLAECLGSIGSLSTEPGFRISKCIVVDNASKDGSAEGLGALPFPVAIVRNATNRGFGAGCNRGVAEGRAEYILLLNPDLRLFPETLGAAVAFLEEPGNSRVGLLGVQLVDDECRVQPSIARFPTPASLLYQMLGLERAWPRRFPPFLVGDRDPAESRAVQVLQGAFLLVRRAAFEGLGGFDERYFMYYEDVDLCFRASRAGWSAWYFAGARAFHRGAGTTEMIKAERLAYWLESRVRYTASHFGTAAALGVVAASLTLELGARLVWNLLRRTGRHFLDTLGAYRLYVKNVPRALKS